MVRCCWLSAGGGDHGNCSYSYGGERFIYDSSRITTSTATAGFCPTHKLWLLIVLLYLLSTVYCTSVENISSY